MTDYQPRVEVEGQLALLPAPAPKPAPHEGARAAVLQALRHAPHPVDIHDLAAVIDGQESGWIARRLGELADDGFAVRVGEHRGRHGRTTTLWEAA